MTHLSLIGTGIKGRHLWLRKKLPILSPATVTNEELPSLASSPISSPWVFCLYRPCTKQTRLCLLSTPPSLRTMAGQAALCPARRVFVAVAQWSGAGSLRPRGGRQTPDLRQAQGGHQAGSPWKLAIFTLPGCVHLCHRSSWVSWKPGPVTY